MIVRKAVGSGLKLAPCSQVLRYNYVSEKKINENVKDIDTSSYFGKMKWAIYYIKFIMTEGFKEVKEDFNWIRNTPQAERYQNPQNIQRFYRIKANLSKLAVPFFLNLLPFGNLFVILLLKFSPQSLPSWIQIEEEEKKRRIEYERIKKFINNKYEISEIDYKTADVEDLKLLSLALTGRIVDGTIIINRIFNKQLNFNTGPMSHVSAWILRQHIKRHFKHNPQFHALPEASVEQKIDMIVNRKQ